MIWGAAKAVRYSQLVATMRFSEWMLPLNRSEHPDYVDVEISKREEFREATHEVFWGEGYMLVGALVLVASDVWRLWRG